MSKLKADLAVILLTTQLDSLILSNILRLICISTYCNSASIERDDIDHFQRYLKNINVYLF